MKPLVLGLLLVLLPLAAMAQNQHFKFTQNGEFANLSGSTGPNESFSLQVSRLATTPGGTSASLTYSAFSVSPDFTIIEIDQIVATIPGSAFTGQNTQRLVLDVDTSQLDPSTSLDQTCIVDLTTFTVTCGPGPQGQIHLEFRENGIQRSQVLALEQVSTIGPFTTRLHQRSDNSSANAEGMIFDVPISSTTATVGVNRSSTMEIVRNP